MPNFSRASGLGTNYHGEAGTVLCAGNSQLPLSVYRDVATTLEVSYNSRTVPKELSLHYFRWLIEDGYPDRQVGTTFEWFNVDFWADQPLAAMMGTN